ncbi:MAG: carbohydrate-binding protein [Bacteroidales bacterium]|nr:carbohydrate-binding protein [Bacteroidales bacterium]
MKRKIITIFFIACTLFAVHTSTFAEIISGTAYKINSCFTGKKALSTPNASPEENAGIIAWTETNVPAQRWIATGAGENFFYLANAYSGRFLTEESHRPKAGDKLIQKLNDKEFSRWEFIPVQDNNYPDAYYIRFSINASGETGLYLELAGNTEGADVSLQARRTDADSLRQMWTVVPEDVLPNRVTPAFRDSVMRGFKNYFYKKANVGYVLGSGGWWGDAEMIETILDAYETTGKQEYKTMFIELYNNFTSRNGVSWLDNEYNDDIAWMVIASVRAYLMFGNDTYLNHAQNNFDRMYSRALLPSGMLRWKQTPTDNQGTNSCINGPAEVAACYLSIATGNEDYYEKAKALYALQRQYLYDSDTGKVFDSGAWDGNTFTVGNDWSSIYNQGTFLGAALMLYNHYGTTRYKNDAHKIVEWTRNNLCNTRGVISVCGSGNDLQGFKGIFMRYLRRYIVDLAVPDKVEWMQQNALQAYNNRNSKGIIWTAWWEKTAENFIFSDGYNFSNQPFGCSTAVSAAFNAPLDENRIIKNAFETIEAEHFDYLKGIIVEQTDGITAVSNTADNYYTVYNHVDFGEEQPATGIELLVQGGRQSNAKIEIHADSLSGELMGTVDVPNGSDWVVVETPITPITGRHHIYLVYKKEGFKVDHFRFTKETVRIEKPDALLQIKLYPNPAITDLNLLIPHSGQLCVYNALGKEITSLYLPAGTATFNINKYNPGVYLVNMTTNHGTFFCKFLKK